MTDTQRDYRDTLFLPKTDFPMRAGLPKAEPKWLDMWNERKLYQALREQSKGREQYCLHDGPPYANGHIHMGTALNKIHKDIINRSHQMLGYDANYVPGWDCHGLPIEWKVEEEFRAKGKSKDDVKPSEFRARCREYAQEWLDVQREEFCRLGVIGDWENPYVTMRPESEADICEELLKIAMTGQLYRGSKPIMWSPVEQTALAEAEVEYKDKKGTQIYVRFPVDTANSITFAGDQLKRLDDLVEKPAAFAAEEQNLLEEVRTQNGRTIDDLNNAYVVIWTTTPWTIPANRAVSFSDTISYGLYEITELADAPFPLGQKVGERLIVADKLWDNLANASFIANAKRLRQIEARELDGLVLSHPLAKQLSNFDRMIPLLSGDHVTDDAGTGFVHTAPSHGEDDFNVWMANHVKLARLKLDQTVPMTLDDAGRYTSVIGAPFEGESVVRTSGKKRGQDGGANPTVIKALVEAGNLLARAPITVRDAHSWRSKAPVIRRATPQWFISMSKGGLRDTALEQIEQTTFYPPRAQNRLRTMVADRPDWLVSRQRAWGVPITLLVDADGRMHTERDDAAEINARILAKVREHGVDGWFDTPAEEFITEPGWTKVNDILDVWFDSGCTHAFCLKQRDDLPDRADLYLEGSDQHRGWFQSSLLESCAVYGEAPYKAVMTDGFVVDDKGLKMSKSLGNTISPLDIANKYGVDILRLWVASSDVYNDLKIGDEIIKTNVDAYRKLRNTLRYLVASLDGYDEADAVDYDDMPALERWVLHRLHELTGEHDKLVRGHEHRKLYSELFNFCTNDLSSFYFDIRKDALYCDPLDSTRRRACRTVLHAVYVRLATWLAPILSFTMEEVWQVRNESSVHLELFRDAPERWENAALAHRMETVRTFRDQVNEAIEPLRRDKVIKSSLEARVIAPAGDVADALEALGISRQDTYADPADPKDVLADYLIVSEADLGGSDIVIEDLKDTAATKCARSWKYFQGEGEITPRDAAAVAALGMEI